MKLSEELMRRGFVAQNTFDKASDLDEQKRTFYIGFDPSDSSLTIGNLASIMMAKVFMRYGYKPIFLVGGATGMIGDPKDTEERRTKTLDEIEKNKAGIRAQLEQILGDEVKLVDNYDWFKNVTVLPFLREVGKQFSMTQLLDRDFVKSRIGEGGSGVSYAEFSYSLIQGYDFLHLYREYGATLQLCGTDQFGNSVSGMHLIKRLENGQAHVWSCPLIIDKASGRKFGKSEGNAVWLDPERTTPYEYYQFWLNTNDEMVGDLLKVYTEIDPTEIDAILQRHSENPSARTAQKTLALAATEILHGHEMAASVARVSDVLFGDKDVHDLPADGLELLSKVIPTVHRGTTVVETLVKSGLASSNGEAQRLIKQNAISINREKVTADTEVSELSLVKKGKNSFVLVR
jgi:tyrosyl-tRNA synthetase